MNTIKRQYPKGSINLELAVHENALLIIIRNLPSASSLNSRLLVSLSVNEE